MYLRFNIYSIVSMLRKYRHPKRHSDRGEDTPPKKAYPLTIQHYQLKIDIFSCRTGKHDAYQTLTMVSITLTTLRFP